MTPDNQQAPPPIPPAYRKRTSYGLKIFLMGVMCCVLMIGVLAIWAMSYSRESSNREVAESIVRQWGSSVYINGPVAKADSRSASRMRPVAFTCQAEVATKSLHRSIYEAEVFTADVHLSGNFNRDSLTRLGDTVVLELGVPTKQVVKLDALSVSGKKIPWQKSDTCMVAYLKLSELPAKIDFTADFEIRGSEAIFVKQIGETSTITINGEAHNPSFNGSSLPVDRATTDRGRFRASWKGYVPDGVVNADRQGFVGTEFLVGVDRYQKVARSMKYSFIIILLTFISVLFVEIMRRQQIPLLNYFLVGAALIIFYSLLLSFVEFVSFGYAFLIAAAMTVVLITGYMWKMLGSRKTGLSIGAVLSMIYISCYVMLSISTYALLLGSLLLFVSLAAIMYASLKIRWG